MNNTSTNEGQPPVALIAGPTASGKSDLAVRLGQALKRAVVINADSAQVYADLRVLSARPNETEMGGVPHRLFGAWDGADSCSAADWAEAAKREIAEAHASGAVPILVGGTGLYLRTLLEGIAPVPPIDPAIRAEVRALAVADAHASLAREDPARASALARTDTTRIARALEVVRSTGLPLSAWQERKEGGIAGQIALHSLILLPERQWLYERCDRRFSAMLEQGAIDEVEALLARQLAPDLPVMRAIGVPEIAAYVTGSATLDEARNRAQQATRNYVKRQVTWLRHQCPREWCRTETFPYDEKTLFEALLRGSGLT